eukprot:GEMP01027730.1.p1 GENE.GEMP01027730.1~~GEMP01027730.1.p1  ORF type:complete len:102 (+),score=3.69 GEMP01027730.1:374-679(+)
MFLRHPPLTKKKEHANANKAVKIYCQKTPSNEVVFVYLLSHNFRCFKKTIEHEVFLNDIFFLYFWYRDKNILSPVLSRHAVDVFFCVHIIQQTLGILVFPM